MKFIPLTNTELSDIEIKRAQRKSKSKRKPTKNQWKDIRNKKNRI